MKYFRLVLALPLVMALQTGAYAIFELAGYGGYSWGRHVVYYPERDTDDSAGPQFGGYAHFTGGIYPVRIGAGLFHNSSVLATRKDGSNTDVIRRTTGLSLALQVTIPTTDLAVYGRAGFSCYDHYILKPDNGARRTKGRFFSTAMAGGGLAYALYGPLWIFTEYLFLNGKYDDNDREFFRTHAVNLGVKLSI
jgi:hypothetical protein